MSKCTSGYRRVGRVHDAGIHAGCAHGCNRFDEALRLYLEIERLDRIRRGEVGERANQIKRAVEAHLAQKFDDLIVTHADAVHARIQGQVIRRAHPVGIGHLAVADGELGRVDARHHLVRQKQRDGRDGWLRQDEDGRVHQSLAQLDSLVDSSNAQVIRTRVESRLGATHGAMPIGVGFDDGHEAHTCADALLDSLCVVPHRIQVDLGP